jgi:hypothetical protein
MVMTVSLMIRSTHVSAGGDHKILILVGPKGKPTVLKGGKSETICKDS